MTQTPSPTPNLLELRQVAKSFSGVQALRGVSLDVRQGEVMALVGENGAGKSTLMKILCGVYPGYDGEMRLDGATVRLHSPREAQVRGIAIVHQELNLIPELTIAENLFLGREPKTALGRLDKPRMERDARALLDRLQSRLRPEQRVADLRVGEQQIVEIAKALGPGARLLILDEPTSALSTDEIRHLMQVMDALKRDGVTLIYISHKFDEVFEVADRITVLRDGASVATLNASETDTGELIRLMVGRELQELFPPRTTPPDDAPADALRVERVSLRASDSSRRSLQEIFFRVAKGEIVGVAGLMGAGRTELLETLFGVYGGRAVSGEIFVGGRACRFTSPRDAIRAGIGFVTEDRKGQSLIVEGSVRENVTLAALKRFLRLGWLQKRGERAAVGQAITSLRIKTPGADAWVETLSGGNQQKVALAKWLETRPRLLLLDEPTRGIDVGAKAEIYALIRELAEQGVAVLMASSEMPELLGLCDRILVLSEGRLTADLPQEQATQEAILTAATAASPIAPPTTRTAAVLHP